ncbi:MAG TPA: M15 family metallopeptidase [Clostridia bacterium]|nr:M15 family metallopeptidase [Clostridia bacterium]
MRQIKPSLRIGAVFIGTVVGAGFATGQEIMQFFTCFGKIGMVTLILSGMLFYIIAAAVMKTAVSYSTYNYKDFIYHVAGNKTGFVFDILVTVFLFIGTSIMFSGSGALFQESLGLSRIWGIVIMALLTLVVILQALTGILRINSIIVPVLFTVIVAVLAATVFNCDIGSIGLKLSGNYDGSFFKPLVFFLFYCCYNTFLSIGVLTAIPEKIKNISVLKAGVFFGAMGLMLLSLMLNISLTLKSPQVFEYSIPMGYITAGLGNVVKSVVNLCVWCEIFSTAVSNTFSIAKRLSGNKHLTYPCTCFITVISCLPLAFMEFKGLISFFYPLFGALSMFIIFRLLFISYRLEGRKKRTSYLLLIFFLVIAFVYAIGNPQQSFRFVRPASSLYEITMKQDLLCLMLAYPDHIKNVERSNGRVYIVMKFGNKILYDDKRTKSIEAKIADPDLQDMMEQAYPTGPVKKLSHIKHDPGRARIYSLLDEVYGTSREEIENNLTNVKAGDRTLRFNKNNRAAEALENVMKELDILVEKRQDIRDYVYPCGSTYNYRNIAGTDRLSLHSYGIAIDLVQDKRDYWRWASREEGQNRLSSYPAELVELFERNSFIWGGKWGHFDMMHFEYRPEILIKVHYFGNTRRFHKMWYDGVPLKDAYIKNCIKKINDAVLMIIFPFRSSCLIF